MGTHYCCCIVSFSQSLVDIKLNYHVYLLQCWRTCSTCCLLLEKLEKLLAAETETEGKSIRSKFTWFKGKGITTSALKEFNQPNKNVHVSINKDVEAHK